MGDRLYNMNNYNPALHQLQPQQRPGQDQFNWPNQFNGIPQIPRPQQQPQSQQQFQLPFHDQTQNFYQNNRPAMTFQQNQARQLEMLKLQQNSMQPQSDMFLDPNRRPSPNPPMNVPQIQAKLTPQQIPQIQNRMTEMKTMITNLETQLAQIAQSRGQLPDGVIQQRIRSVTEDLTKKRDMFSKLNQILMAYKMQNNPSTSSSMPAQTNASLQPWLNQPSGSQQQPFTMQPAQQQPSQPNVSSPALQSAQPTPSHNFLPNNRPPISQPNPPFPKNMPAPNQVAYQPPSSNPSIPPQTLSQLLAQIGPISKEQFTRTYPTYVARRNGPAPPGQRWDQLTVDNRPVDIYTLHVAVFEQGGPHAVMAQDLWALVAGRLGFVQFPDGPKSGPATASQIEAIYKQHLADYDKLYIQSCLDKKNQLLGAFPRAPNQQPTFTQQQLAAFSDKTPEQLRAGGVPENVIEAVNRYREQQQLPVNPQQYSIATPLRPQPPGQDPNRSFPPNTQFPNVPQNVIQPNNRLIANNLQSAVGDINRMKNHFLSLLPGLPQVDVPTNQRLEYNQLIETVNRHAGDIDSKLSVYLPHLQRANAPFVPKLIQTIVTVQHQRTLLSSNNPRFILNYETLQNMHRILLSANDAFTNIHAKLSGTPPSTQTSHQSPPRAPTNQPSPPQQPPSVSASVAGNRTLVRPPSVGKKVAQALTPKTPTPPPPASTPSASASTPAAAASPPTPKSPKSIKPGKKLPVKQRRSISKVSPAAAPVAAPSPPNGVKRPREEETPMAMTPNNAALTPDASSEPSPKRPKTEWEGPSETLKKQNEVVEAAMKSDDDAAAFFESVSEAFRIASQNEGQESTLTADLTETLEMLLKGCSAVPDGPDLSILDLPDHSNQILAPVTDDFGQFFDFSSFGADDDKVTTPDLSSSSSTNLSPESEADILQPSAFAGSDLKSEELSDPLRLGTLKEIDGGESAYYHSNVWKYDGPMPVMEQPWAVFTS